MMTKDEEKIEAKRLCNNARKTENIFGEENATKTRNMTLIKSLFTQERMRLASIATIIPIDIKIIRRNKMNELFHRIQVQSTKQYGDTIDFLTAETFLPYS